jgi:uncharacterized protein
MTPQEQQLVAELFDRLASLEGQRRDPDAERLIREGLGRAPNSVYALVQSVLVQDEALKRASARIEELEHAAGNPEPAQGGGFLDSMRNVIMGQPRGSVPSVRPGGQDSSGVWGTRPEPSQPAGNPQAGYPPAGYPQAGYPQAGYPQGGMMGGGMMAPGMGGGSFLGTAAATVAGVVGGAMLMNGIRGMMGGGHQGFGGDYAGTGAAHAASPWDSGGGSSGSGGLSRDAGLNDIGGGGRGAASYDNASSSTLFGGNDQPNDDQPIDQQDDVADSGDFDGGGGDSDSA